MEARGFFSFVLLTTVSSFKVAGLGIPLDENSVQQQKHEQRKHKWRLFPALQLFIIWPSGLTLEDPDGGQGFDVMESNGLNKLRVCVSKSAGNKTRPEDTRRQIRSPQTTSVLILTSVS